jgi:hypothetical protein
LAIDHGKDYMKFHYIILIGAITTIVTYTSCNQQKSGAASTIHTDSIKPDEKLYTRNAAAIKKQNDLQMTMELDNPKLRYSYTEADVNIALPVIADGLAEKHFVTLSDAAFQEKMKSLFGDIYDAEKCKTKDHEQFVTLLVDNKERDREYDYTVDNIFLSKKYKFITPVPLIGDYVNFTDSLHYTISMRSVDVSRNKYLLNDSKADLSVLLNDDSLFLKTLVKSLGYTKEPRINDLVMNDYLRMREDKMPLAGEIIFVKDCNGNLIIKEELLDWIKSHTTETDIRFLEALDAYTFDLYEKRSDIDGRGYVNHPFDYFTLDEKRKIVAYIANIYVPLYHELKPKHPELWPEEELLKNHLFTKDPGLREYLSQQKYFSLPALRQELDTAVIK